MPQGITPKKGKKNRKHGRNADKCKAYRARSYDIKLNKVRGHLARHPNDLCALTALQRCKLGGLAKK